MEDEIGASVLAPGKFVLFEEERSFLTVADRSDPSRIDTQVNEVIAGIDRPLLTEGQVVFLRSAIIAIAFYDHCIIHLLEKVGVLYHSFAHVRSNAGLIKIEINGAEAGRRATMQSFVLVGHVSCAAMQSHAAEMRGAGIAELPINGEIAFGIAVGGRVGDVLAGWPDATGIGDWRDNRFFRATSGKNGKQSNDSSKGDDGELELFHTFPLDVFSVR